MYWVLKRTVSLLRNKKIKFSFRTLNLLVAIIVSFFIGVIIILLGLRINKCYYCDKINGRQSANVHDFEGGVVDVLRCLLWQSLEISVPNQRLKSFEQTDAMLVWYKNKRVLC